MLQNLKQLYGSKLTAVDGDIGQVKDFYFDDIIWVIRYLVADTASWMTGRQVLLTPHSFGGWDQYQKILHIKLRKEQIQNSPSIESHKPVSRQFEIDYYRYYGWPAYWDGAGMWGLGGYPVTLPPSKEEMQSNLQYHHRNDKHLQSANSINGYQIQATDGEIGSVSGFMVDDSSWVISRLVVETGHWYSGKEILISPNRVERISYEESKVYVNLTKSDIQLTAENHLVKGE